MEKGEMDTIFWLGRLKEGKQLRIGYIFAYNTKTHFIGTGHETAY
jgi:hypothetical protein